MYDLTPKESAVFDALLKHRSVSKEQLLIEAWGVGPNVAAKLATRTVAMTISRMRKKMPPTIQIECEVGSGYSLLVG